MNSELISGNNLEDLQPSAKVLQSTTVYSSESKSGNDDSTWHISWTPNPIMILIYNDDILLQRKRKLHSNICSVKHPVQAERKRKQQH